MIEIKPKLRKILEDAHRFNEYTIAKYNAQNAVNRTRDKHLLPNINYKGHWTHEAKLRQAYYNIRGW